MNPVEEALEALEKEAGLGGFARKALESPAGQSFREAAGASFGVAAVAGIGAGVAKLVDAVQKKRQFGAMLEVNPDLREHQRTNAPFFNTAYNSMRTMNPSYGKDPIVAGTIMRRMMESPDAAGGVLMSTMRDPAAPGGSMLRADFRAGPFSISKDL